MVHRFSGKAQKEPAMSVSFAATGSDVFSSKVWENLWHIKLVTEFLNLNLFWQVLTVYSRKVPYCCFFWKSRVFWTKWRIRITSMSICPPLLSTTTVASDVLQVKNRWFQRGSSSAPVPRKFYNSTKKNSYEPTKKKNGLTFHGKSWLFHRGFLQWYMK